MATSDTVFVVCGPLVPILEDAQILVAMNEHPDDIPKLPDHVREGYSLHGAKRILIGAMSSGVWPQLVERHPKIVPSPIDVAPHYEIASDWHLWPKFGKKGDPVSVLESMMDQQYDIVAVLAFMAIGTKDKAANKDTGLPPQERTKTAAEDDKADSMADPDAMEADFDPTDHTTQRRFHLPDPSKVARDYSLTQDWPGWPSAGPGISEFADIFQRQHGLIADTLFEFMKVISIQTATTVIKAEATKKEEEKAEDEDADADAKAV